jgi:DNA (cytosine-5)-methyltransferase 1
MGYKYLELFAGTGIGGMVLDKHECENIGYSEFDSHAIKNYNANFPDRINYGDITKIDEKKLPDFDIMIGGSPCQNISIMSKTWNEDKQVEGLEGQESKLFYDYIRILNHKLPRWFIFENVRNLLSSNNGEDFKIVKEMFEENYNIKYEVLNTEYYGLPQTRRRLYIVGQRKDLGEFGYKFPKAARCILTAQDLLDEQVDDKYYLTEKMLATVLSRGTGGWDANPETDLVIARPLCATLFKMHRASQDNYYHTEYQPIGKTNLRRLTPRECARLQGLDDTYKIVVSDTQAYKLFGNAMSYNVVDAVIDKLFEYINNSIK